MLASSQIRAARGLLNWSQTKLAGEAGISLATVKRVESTEGRFQGKAETLWRIQDALQRAGIVFEAADKERGAGVRLAKGDTG